MATASRSTMSRSRPCQCTTRSRTPSRRDLPPQGSRNGYVVSLGGTRVYIGGDTGCTAEMQALTDVEVAFVPMNLPYTMSPDEAAACVKAMKPRVVYPYHFVGSDPKAFGAALAGTGIEVRLRDWYAAGR